MKMKKYTDNKHVNHELEEVKKHPKVISIINKQLIDKPYIFDASDPISKYRGWGGC